MLALLVLASNGCDEESNMVHQPRFETFEASEFFPDGAVARPLPAGTVPREALSWEGDAFVPLAAEEITLDMLRRGRQRYDIYCSMCHARDGYGNGMVVQRGFPAPPSMHEERLRRVPDAHIYNVISNGLGNMPAYGGMIPPQDRRGIIAYVRALQLSQHAGVEDVPPDRRGALSAGTTVPSDYRPPPQVPTGTRPVSQSPPLQKTATQPMNGKEGGGGP